MSTPTINGWPIINSSSDRRLKLFTIKGTDRKMRLRSDVGAYLAAFAAEYDARVRPIDKGTFDDWAWCALRNGRASTRPSDHCAGVAIDLNAVGEGKQGQGLTYWLTHPKEYKALKALLAKYKYLEWGGSWKRFIDPMHFTLRKGVTVAQVKAEIERMGL